MGLFFLHILKSSMCLIIFYFTYKFLLSKETFFRSNRFLILAILAVSFIIPFLKLSQSTTSINPVPLQTGNIEYLIWGGTSNQDKLFNFTEFFVFTLFLIYLIGAVIQLIICIYNFFTIYRITRGSKQIPYSKYIIAVTKQQQSPFSWGKYIVISQKDYDNQPEFIIQHELVHLRNKHFCDLLIMEISSIVLWFNPIIWSFKKELRNIHEFEVDNTLLEQGVDAKAYQLLLIKKTVGPNLFSIANSFNQSSISKRVRMMLKQKSNPWAQLKYLCVFFLMLFSIFVFARPEINRKLENISSKEIKSLIEEQGNILAETFKAKDIPDKKLQETGQNIIHKTEEQSAVSPAIEVGKEKTNGTPICIVDGKETTYQDFQKISSQAIQKVTILKDKAAIEKYGTKAQYGAIIMELNPEWENKISPVTPKEPIKVNGLEVRGLAYIFLINGKPVENQQEYLEQKDTILQNPENFESIISLFGKAAKEKYGEIAEYGVCEIYLKK